MKFAPILALTCAAIALAPSVPLAVRGAQFPGEDLASSPSQTSDAFAEGYDIGYRMGFDRGIERRAAEADYQPEILGVGGELELEEETDRRAAVGYQAGFLAGFHEGYTAGDASANRREIEGFNDGYSRGYDVGWQEALLCRQARDCPYAPKPIPDREGEPHSKSGYQVGYWQAFEKVWTRAGDRGSF